MPTNQTETETYEEQRKANEKPQKDAQPAQPEEQEHTDDFEEEDTEELAADGANTDDDDLAAGDEGLDDANERHTAADDADIESGKRLDRDEKGPQQTTDVERDLADDE